jgi:Tfp pilus assembly protein PilF
MRRAFVLLFSVVLWTASHGPSWADIGQDCFQTTLEKQRSVDKIIAVCTEAVRSLQGTRRGRALVSRATGYMDRGDLDAALRDLDEAIRLEPGNSWAFSGRANVFRMRRQYDRALADLNEIIRRDSSFIGAYVDRGLVHRDRGDFLSARSDFEAVLGMSGGPPAIERWAKEMARYELDRLPRR